MMNYDWPRSFERNTPSLMVVMVNVCYQADIPLIMETALTVGNSMICDWNHALKRGTIGHECMNLGDGTPDKAVRNTDQDFMRVHEMEIQ